MFPVHKALSFLLSCVPSLPSARSRSS